ncbi:two-component regulator propeller domain-containing protein [Cytophagaceae bacterium DM2B3-1]|uniref:Two-component regulator propeller domain-containing protein n=1 Tax=Xanthocytophaga flava TaxID=3048013 RepID=A0ABT7CI51_9BACT|nr:two-component regulator propeller domain-containing protein [Xanthocytophaga flavus]MDJ1493410.1 two-component regulator propeller domain-containing protein [Xanthocytophaga flavus]
MYHRIFFLAIVTGCLLQTAFSQNIPIGTWRTHASYQSMKSVAIARNSVYAGSTSSFFSYDSETQQVNVLSKLDGFSSTSISKIAYDSQTETVIIAYTDGTIDLLQGTELYTITSIASSTSITTSKQNNHILINNKLAYLAYDFGVVVVDLSSHQIKETYQNLGANGVTLAIYGTAILDTKIYLATASGVLFAPLTGVNLLDFASWSHTSSSEGVPAGAATLIAAFANQVYTVYATNETFKLANEKWSKATELPLAKPLFLKVSQQKLLVGYPQKIIVWNGQATTTLAHSLIVSPSDAEYTSDGVIWIADAVSGLLSNEKGDFQQYAPSGTVPGPFQRLEHWDSEIVALPGGYTNSYTARQDTAGFSVFTSSGWQNYTSQSSDVARRVPTTKDLIVSIYNPVNRTYYVASFGEGILVKSPDSNWQRLSESGAPPASVKVTGMTVDIDGTLWVLIYGAFSGEPSLYARTIEGIWKGYTFSTFAARQALSFIMDDYQHFWMPLSSGGLWVFDSANNRGKLLSTTTGQGGLPNASVYAVVKDSLGQIWVGTGRGAAYFFNPWEVFESQAIDAITPIYEGRQVLRDEIVTSIYIDGGNRKWFGSQNGAWLFDADITNQLAHFTAATTPLLSDNILDIEIQPITGEVFFATDAGLISYRGTATAATTTHSQVKVFPNPVRPGFSGTVGISGLAANSIVKITDMAGRLVYQTRANGGTAVWSVQNYKGQRVSSGMYLIFSSSDDGTEKFVTKIAVIE